MGRYYGGLLSVIFCLGMLAPVAASPIGFTGNPALDNWVLQGNSLTLGTYIRGAGNLNFNVYSSAFYLDASSPLVGGQWQMGDLVLGLGGVPQGASNNFYKPRMVAKFGAEGALFSPSTTLTPPGNGLGSFGSGVAGSGGVQEDAPNHFILQSFEVPLDLSYLSDPARGNLSPSPSLHGKADMAWQIGSSGAYTDAYVPDVGAHAPVPGTLLLLGSGLVGVVGLRKKLRK